MRNGLPFAFSTCNKFAKTPPYPPSSQWGLEAYTGFVGHNSLPKIFTITGVTVTILGLLVPFIGVYSLFDVFVPAIAIGILVASVGLVMWSLRIARARCRQLAALLLVGGVMGYIVGVSNVHTWGLFLLVAVPAALLGIVLFGVSCFASR